jgi:hypothetical protein
VTIGTKHPAGRAKENEPELFRIHRSFPLHRALLT